jgi:hypothetical protein
VPAHRFRDRSGWLSSVVPACGGVLAVPPQASLAGVGGGTPPMPDEALLWVDQAALDGPEDRFAGADGCVGLHAGIEQRPIFFADEMSNGLVRPVLNGSEQGF